jgi:hypothetical protein
MRKSVAKRGRVGIQVSLAFKICVLKMGLHSDKNNGVKAQLRTRFPQAFKEFDDLVEARNASRATREQAYACIDGNVIMMAVPKAATTLDSYIAIVFSSLKKAIATTMLTVVVFDEPDTLTEAKLQEQAKRDSRSLATAVNSSQDLRPSSLSDEYDKQYISGVQDVHELVFSRKSRMRFFDEVAVTVMDRLKAQIKKWNDSGHAGGHVVFDGIDARGADRPSGEARAPGLLSSSEEAAQLFARDFDIGEGDLKLAFVGRTMRGVATREGIMKDATLGLTCTIDTDSFAIELIEEAKRHCHSETTPVNTLLCMRERAKRGLADEDNKAFYLCCDIALLHELLKRHMWGTCRSPTPLDHRAAITLMAAGWALCGCDFVELKGMRSDVVFEAMPELVKTRTDSLDKMKYAWTGKREDLLETHLPMKDLLVMCASRLMDIPRIKKDKVPGIRSPNEMVLKQTSWLSSYWNGWEHKGNLEDFGYFRPFA